MATDNDMNKELYGKPLDATQIVRDGAAPVPTASKALVGFLERCRRSETNHSTTRVQELHDIFSQAPE